MKISEVIKVLNDAKKHYGDLEFVVNTLVDGQFIIEFGRNIDVIGIPSEHDENDVENVVAILNYDENETEEV